VSATVRTIAFIRETALLTDALVESYVAAQQAQIDGDFAPIWNLPATCVFVPPGQPIPAGAWQIVFKDHSDEAGDLGYHDDQGNPIGYVFVADCLSDGVNWTVTASHETLELLADPTITKVVDASGEEYSWEVCDACEDDRFAYPVNGHHLSDFVLPSWFDPNGQTPYTFRNAIQQPFGLAEGGYIGVRTLPDGPWTQRMAMTAGPRQVKRATSRTMRRFGAV
jgi:hypothetical protein